MWYTVLVSGALPSGKTHPQLFLIETGFVMKKEKRELTPIERSKRMKTVIIIVIAASVVLLLLCAMIPQLAEGLWDTRGREEITVAPSLLEDTKEEGFDIFEYEEYLSFDRSMYIRDEGRGTCTSLTRESAEQHGKDLVFLYDLIGIITRGDYETYNDLVSGNAKKYESFTQQQIYGVYFTKDSEKQLSDGGKSYTEYVYRVEFKIHENNGTFRRDIEPDASRPQYYVINDSEGELKLMDVINVSYVDP